MAHVATITIDHTKVPGDLTDYVGLIVPDGSAGYSALYALCLEGGGDIRLFKSDDTTELAREIVSFSVSAETGEIHYKYSGTLSSSVDTDIHVYADGSSADYAVGATYGRNAVWSDYSGVFHQKDGSGTAINSTGNGNLTAVGSPASAVGEIGDAVNYTGGNDYHSNNSVTGATTLVPITLQAWVSPNASSSTESIVYVGEDGAEHGLLLRSNGVWALSQAQSNVQAEAVISLTSGTFYMFHGVFTSSTQREIFVNGELEATSTATEVVADADGIIIGSRHSTASQGLNARTDEVRVRNSALSADWITTEYNNQNSYSTFYSVAAVAGGSTSAQAARRGAVMMM